MADEQQQHEPQQQTNAADDGSRDWKAEFQKLSGEIRKVSRERDDYRKRVKDLDGFDPEEYRTLKQQAEKAEEERAKKAGEFEKLQQQLVQKHQTELVAEKQAREAAETRLRQTIIGRAFADALDLFGPNGKTKYIPSEAEAIFGKQVRVQDDGVLVVLDSDGDVILDGKTGKPAAFAAAMDEYINSLPDKQFRLRGSGKTGSGSSGGATHGSETTDLSRLRTSDFRDPKIRQAVKDRQAAAGGLQIGPAWDRAPRS